MTNFSRLLPKMSSPRNSLVGGQFLSRHFHLFKSIKLRHSIPQIRNTMRAMRGENPSCARRYPNADRNYISRTVHCARQQLIRNLIFRKSIELPSFEIVRGYLSAHTSRPMIAATRLFNYRVLRTDAVSVKLQTHIHPPTVSSRFRRATEV